MREALRSGPSEKSPATIFLIVAFSQIHKIFSGFSPGRRRKISVSCYRVHSCVWEAAAWLSTPLTISVGSWVCSHNTTARAVSMQRMFWPMLACAGMAVKPADTFLGPALL